MAFWGNAKLPLLHLGPHSSQFFKTGVVWWLTALILLLGLSLARDLIAFVLMKLYQFFNTEKFHLICYSS